MWQGIGFQVWEKQGVVPLGERRPLEFEIVRQVGVLSEKSKGWKKELNLISWGGREPTYDLRDWSEDRRRMGKGVTLTAEELDALKKIIDEEAASLSDEV